jgi:hypothetical protein
MVENFSKRISDNGISPEEMSVVCADLKGEESELDGEKFDVVVVRVFILFALTFKFNCV